MAELADSARAKSMTTLTSGQIVISPPTALSASSVLDVFLSMTSRYADDWLRDAIAEVRPGPERDPHARRREIVFAVNASESYLVEWVIGLLPSTSYVELYDKLLEYFPKPQPRNAQTLAKNALKRLEAARNFVEQGNQEEALEAIEQAISRNRDIYDIKVQNLVESWNSIPKMLKSAGYIAQYTSNNKSTEREDFKKLVDHRNDTVHAGLSWPQGISANPSDKREPRTTTDTLINLKPGWPTEVVIQRILQLHQETGTSTPDWLGKIRIALSATPLFLEYD